MLIITLISVFLFVTLLTGGTLYFYLTRRSVIRERLEKMMPQNLEVKPALIRQRTPLQSFLGRLGQLFHPPQQDRMKYTRYIVAAGFRKETLPIFLGSKIALTLLLPAIFMFAYAFPKGIIFKPQILTYELIFAILGFLLPSYWLQRRVNYRTTEIFHALPDMLDLLTVCVEAGMGIDAALIKASDNPQFRGNPLAEELKVAGMETRAGKLRSDALRDMANRTMVDDVASFVTMLVQSEKFGTSLSQTLRVHSDVLRTKRRQFAEEAAAKTSIKMLFPLVIFVFPALLVVLIGPAAFLINNAFK